jgi:predicted component of type VI protein secretion system
MSKYENLRSKHEELLDEITSKKIEQERERALKDQQISFQDQKINDLSKQLESSISRYEERIKTERDEH